MAKHYKIPIAELDKRLGSLAPGETKWLPLLGLSATLGELYHYADVKGWGISVIRQTADGGDNRKAMALDRGVTIRRIK